MNAMTPFPIVDRVPGGAMIAGPSSAMREQVLHSLNGRWRPVQHAHGGPGRWPALCCCVPPRRATT
jgi:hypothetical protein